MRYGRGGQQRAAVLCPRLNLVLGSRPSLKKLGAQEPFSPAWPATKGAVQCKKGVPPRCVACLSGVLGHLAPVHRCARLVRCFACAVSWATWLLFTGVPAWCVVLLVWCPRSLGSCSPVCLLGVLCCVCGVLGHLAPVHRCARSACGVVCAVSWATRLLFTGVPAACAFWRVRCPGPPGSCSPVCPLGALLCLCGVLGHLAPVHRCAARCVAWVCGVLGHLAPLHRCARSVCCFACAVSWATWLLFTGVPARSVALRARCPGPGGSCSPVCPLGALFFLCSILGDLAPVHWCASSARCLCVRCPGPLGSCSPVCPLGALFCLCGVLGHLAPVHQCACSVCCVVSAVSWATWRLFKGVSARCVVLGVRCPGPLGSCSPVRSPRMLCGVLGHLAPVHRCARSVCCAVGCVCGASLRGAHSPIRTVAIRSRQGLGTLQARNRPSGRRLFVAGRGWVPSGRTRVHPDGGCSVAGRGWVRCRARTCPSRRWLVLLGSCPRAVARCVLCALSGFAAPGRRRCLAPVRVPWLWPAACLSGVPRSPAWCAAPRPVRSLSVLRLAFPTPWCLSPPRGLAPPAILGGCAGHAEAGRDPGSGKYIWEIPGSPGYQGHASRPPTATVPRRPGASQAGGAPKLPGTPTGSTTREGFPLWHIQQPPATVRPAGEPGQSPRLGGARRHAGATP